MTRLTCAEASLLSFVAGLAVMALIVGLAVLA